MNQSPRGTELEGHLTPEELAVLAERGREGATREALEHLARCRSCMSAYADLVRYRAGWLAFPEAFEGEPHAERRLSGDPGRAFRAGPWRPAWMAAAAVVVVFGAAAMWWVGHSRPPRNDNAIAALLEGASAEGLVIPGGEAGAALRASAYRSPVVEPDEAESVLKRLREEYEEAPPTIRNVQRLAAALVASGQLDLARVYVSEGLERAPEDSRLLTIAGIVAYRSGDPAKAEQHLREALRVSPEDPTAMLNLGLILLRSRGPESAAPFLTEVIQKVPDSPLADRARQELKSFARP